MEWPSKRVPPGGVMQPTKVKYNPEVKEFLNVLKQENMLDIQQRKKTYTLRSSESLPRIDAPKKMPTIIFRPGSSKRRSQNTILNSGAYEREKFQPQLPKVDRQSAIEELQKRMAFGKEDEIDTNKKISKSKQKSKKEKNDNRFSELAKEIKERQDWLEEMKELGQGYKYKEIIEQQIQEKIRLMEKLQLESKSN